jgi:hypothetical protein
MGVFMKLSSMNSEAMRYIAIGHLFQYLTSVIPSTSKWLALLLQVQKV